MMMWFFFAGLLVSSTPDRPMTDQEYDECLYTLQISSMLPTVITASNIHCVEHQAEDQSDYAVMMAQYYISAPESQKEKAIAYYETVVKMNDQSQGLLFYFEYIVNELVCEDINK